MKKKNCVHLDTVDVECAGQYHPALSAVRVFLLNTGNNGVFMYEMSTDHFFQYLVKIEQFQICSIEMEMVAFKSFHAKEEKFHQIIILRRPEKTFCVIC